MIYGFNEKGFIKFALLIIVFSLLTSCARYQRGRVAHIEKTNKHTKDLTDIKITASKNKEYSTKNFTYVQIEFGNKTDEWIDVSKVALNTGDDIKIVLGQRLIDWKVAIQNKVAVDRYNREMFFDIVATGAALGALNSAYTDKDEATKSFIAVMAGAAIAADVNNINNTISDIERSKIFPTNHIYAPFSLPPGLVAKRWLLIQHDKTVSVDKFSFSLFIKNSEMRTYTVRF